MTPDELKDWLQDKPREVAVAMAFRSAARVFPLAVGGKEAPQTLTFTTFRCLLISSVAAHVPTDDINASANAAASAASAVFPASAFPAPANASSSAAFAASSAAFAAAAFPAAFAAEAFAASSAVFSDAAEAFAANANANAAAAFSADFVVLANAQEGEDVPRDVLANPLWPQGDNPLQAVWARSRAQLEQRPGYTFWIDWYDGLLQGRAQNWDLLRDIALIAPDVWDEGAEAVAVEIAKIEALHVSAATPIAERMVWRDDRDMVEVVPDAMRPHDLYNDVLNSLKDAIDDVQIDAEGNRVGQIDIVLRKLTRTLELYSARPGRVHDDMFSQAAVLDRVLADELMAGDEALTSLRDTLRQGAENIRAHMPEVRTMVAARVALRIEEMDAAEREKIARAADLIVEFFNDDYAEEIKGDASVALAEGADIGDIETRDARYRLVSRLSHAMKVIPAASRRFIVSGTATFGTYQYLEAAIATIVRVIRWGGSL